MSEPHPPPIDPRTVRATGRRRARALTAGLAAAAVLGTGAVAVVAAVGDADDASATTTAATPATSGDDRSWSPSGATVTPGSDGSAAATTGGS